MFGSASSATRTPCDFDAEPESAGETGLGSRVRPLASRAASEKRSDGSPARRGSPRVVLRKRPGPPRHRLHFYTSSQSLTKFARAPTPQRHPAAAPLRRVYIRPLSHRAFGFFETNAFTAHVDGWFLPLFLAFRPPEEEPWQAARQLRCHAASHGRLSCSHRRGWARSRPPLNVDGRAMGKTVNIQ